MGFKLGEILGSDILNKMQGNNQKNNKIEKYKIGIHKLEKEQRRENDYDKKIQKTQELKEHLEEILKIVPNDIDMKIKLMYANIKLKQIDEARKLGKELLGTTKRNDVLNGMSIIEEIEGNYDEAIQYINKMLESEPDNEFWKSKIERINNKKEKAKFNEQMSTKEKAYRKIATLERSVRNITENQQEDLLVQGKETDKKEIIKETYLKVYSQVKEIAEEILLSNPKEIIAREKLVKSLYILGEIDKSMKVAEDLLEISENDEIALWYMAKMQRGNGNLEGEKQYLEKMIESSQPGTQTKAQQRLEKVKKQIEEKNKQKEQEMLAQENYTEDARKEFIENVEKEFYYGTITTDDIESKISEARKYPNFTRSIIELLDIKSKMNGDLEQKIEELEKYTDSEYSLTPEEYNDILDEISKTRKKIEEEKRIEAYLDKKEEITQADDEVR